MGRWSTVVDLVKDSGDRCSKEFVSVASLGYGSTGFSGLGLLEAALWVTEEVEKLGGNAKRGWLVDFVPWL